MTPEQIAADIYSSLMYFPHSGDEVRELMAESVRADRAQRADALSALHEWAVSVSYSMSTDKSNDWSEEIDALVEIEQMYDLVDSDGERTDN